MLVKLLIYISSINKKLVLSNIYLYNTMDAATGLILTISVTNSV